MQAGAAHTWEITVPNGPYTVLIGAGDPAYTTGSYRIAAEGVVLLNGTPSTTDRWVEGIGTVIVTDGRLTLSNASGAVSNRLAFVEISATEPTSIAQWRALYFGTTNDTATAANDADPDTDGLPNLVEYALGLDPTRADNPSQLIPFLTQTNQAYWFGVTFPRNTNALDLTFHVQTSDSVAPGNWSDIATFANGTGWTGSAIVWESGNTNPRTVTVLDPRPVLSSGITRFLRLLISPQ
jgi:hypothetical protein